MSRDRWSWAGIALVGLTAAVWSFEALSDLAAMVGISAAFTLPFGWTVRIAWGLPLTVDILAVVATRVWLRGTAPADAVRYARTLAWGAIGASVVGNAYHGLLASVAGGSFRLDTVVVSAVPAVVIGAMVHLAVLVGRDRPTAQPAVPEPAAEAPPVAVEPVVIEPVVEPVAVAEPRKLRAVPAAKRVAMVKANASPDTEKLAAIVKAGGGRTAVVKQLGVTPAQARTLLQKHRAGQS